MARHIGSRTSHQHPIPKSNQPQVRQNASRPAVLAAGTALPVSRAAPVQLSTDCTYRGVAASLQAFCRIRITVSFNSCCDGDSEGSPRKLFLYHSTEPENANGSNLSQLSSRGRRAYPAN